LTLLNGFSKFCQTHPQNVGHFFSSQINKNVLYIHTYKLLLLKDFAFAAGALLRTPLGELTAKEKEKEREGRMGWRGGKGQTPPKQNF